MLKYKIERWDAIITNGNIYPVPVIYIKPDQDFINLVNAYNNFINVQIDNTNTIYDKKIIKTFVTSLPNVSNPPRNYIKENGFVTLTLDIEWFQYPDPDNLGNIIIINENSSGNKQIQDIQHITENNPSCLECYNKKDNIQNTECIMNTPQIFIIFVIFIIILLLFSINIL